jgi:hypothetical protein
VCEVPQPPARAAATQRNGIHCRLAQPDDGDALGEFLGPEPGISPGDTVILAECNGVIAGAVAIRLVPLVHGLAVAGSIVSRRAVEALYQYAAGYARASGMREAVFVVAPENDRMRQFLELHGAVEKEKGTILTVEVG